METNFRHFNTFKDFVNAKLDASKDENTYEKMLRYFNLEPSLKLRWCRARDLFGS